MSHLMKSWVESANRADCPFPLNNLPYGVFTTGDEEPRCGVAIGDFILDVAYLEEEGVIALDPDGDPLMDLPFWNEVMEAGRETWKALRARLISLLSVGGDPVLSEDEPMRARAFVPMASAKMHLPFVVSEFTDFYAGKQHAQNMGAILRGSPELPANWLHIPIGYNGRASSVVVSGTDIQRPLGQSMAPGAEMPSFGPCKRLDIELEIGAVVGTSTEMGQPITVDQADEMIFGFVLLNDWSARDIQGWEYHPLGPFQGKAFGTSISPWIVTSAALEPFRTTTPPRDTALLPYLSENIPGLYDIALEVTIQPDDAPNSTTISRTNYSRMYYSAAQQLCHHAVGGVPMNAGDLLGSGTISGPDKSEFGSLMELSWGGREPFVLSAGETRTFIEDGDTLTLKGVAKGDGFLVGFGECTGKILPAIKGYPEE